MSKNQLTKRQHHFPRMMLKRFADESGKVFMLNGRNQEIVHSNLNSVAVRKHLYSVHIGDEKDDSLEQKLSSIESDADQALNRVLGDINYSDNRDFQAIIEFAVILMLRTPRVVEMSEDIGASDKMAETLRTKAKEKGFAPETAEEYIKSVQNHKGLSFAETFMHSFKERFGQIVENFDAHLCISDSPDCTFVVSDTYAAIEKIGDLNEKELGTDWWKMPVQIYFPLSANHCLTLTPKKEIEKIGSPTFDFSRTIVEENFIKKVNELAMQQKEAYLYAHSIKEIERLSNGK